MIERVGLKEESQILIPAIAARMNNTPFPEQCNSFENVLNVII
jgi:hypothetical protein